MKTDKIMGAAFMLALAACAQTPKPAAPAVVATVAPPAVLVAPAPEPALEPAVVVAAQRNLRALGYAAGKAGDVTDPAIQRAVLAFQKDQGLEEDGHLTLAIADRLKSVRAELLKAAADSNRNAVFLYSDGSTRRKGVGFLLPAPDGLVSNAPANFLQPLRPGSHASYQLGHRAADKSFTPVTTITCKASRGVASNTALNGTDAVLVDCRGDGAKPLQWRATYSPRLGVVLRLEGAGAARDLVAIRPVTGDWPSAARTGLDWAITHALDTAGNTPVQWSSTGVAPHFDISAGAALAGRDAGLSGRYAALACRRFEMVQTGGGPRYPGIACQTAPGSWSLPGSAMPLASPSNGMAQSAPHALKSALN